MNIHSSICFSLFIFIFNEILVFKDSFIIFSSQLLQLSENIYQVVSRSKCLLECSASNAPNAALTWYKGSSLFSIIKISDLNMILSLLLEVEYHDKNNYSCVINNHISNKTTHLDISELCQSCSGGDNIYLLNLSIVSSN